MNQQQKDEIYRTYSKKVFFYILGKGLNEADAEDLAANVFVKVYDKIDAFDPSKASISTWIYRITQNTVIDFFRARKSFEELSEDIVYVDENFDKLAQTETLTELAAALMQLDDRSRALVVLVYYDGLTLKEAAEKTGMSYSNSKIIMKKALGTLKKFLE